MKRSMFAVESAAMKFFFSPGTAPGLVALRVLLSLALLVQAFEVAPDFLELYGPYGILQADVARSFRHTRLALSFSEESLRWIGVAYIASLVSLIIGFRVRIASVAAWLCHMMLVGGHFTTYGVDSFAHIFLFYLMVFPSTTGAASWQKTFGLRVLQIHLCIIYMASGIEKAVGPQWQSGEVIWRALMLPVYQQYDMAWLGGYPLLMKLFAWGTLFVEIGYPLLVGLPRTRVLGVFTIVSLHVGIWIFLGLGAFSTVMAVLTLSLFGVGDRWPAFLTPLIRYRRMVPTANMDGGVAWQSGSA